MRTRSIDLTAGVQYELKYFDSFTLSTWWVGWGGVGWVGWGGGGVGWGGVGWGGCNELRSSLIVLL